MSTLTIELSDDLAARLAAASERAHVSQSQLVQEALEKALLPTGESLADKMKDVIGCVDSGVGDLSTNPIHLEGFGQWRK
ncbi:MAG TPA: ribbon-helix-helix protein, CopG family [Chthoniobacter sp.]|jgi:metal-responsive CopG/Arc/MetJ family transcriptional regulator